MAPMPSTARASVNGHDTHASRDAASDDGPAERRRSRGRLPLPGAGIVERIGRTAAGALARRIPTADLDERDPDFIRDNLPRLWLLSTLWFRGEVRGMGNIPAEGPVLLVGNHSGGNMTPDTGVFMLAFSTYFGVERRLHTLTHNLVISWPGLGFLRRYGAVAASPENADAALAGGAAVLVYPGGDLEVHRPSWRSATIDFDQRTGYVRLALEHGVPIVPIVAIGGQETSLFLARGDGVARALGLDRIARLKVLPISLALPWGLNVGDFFGHLPLPAKITVEVLPPIHLDEELGPDPDVDEIHTHVTRLMQDTLDALAAERRLPILG